MTKVKCKLFFPPNDDHKHFSPFFFARFALRVFFVVLFVVEICVNFEIVHDFTCQNRLSAQGCTKKALLSFLLHNREWNMIINFSVWRWKSVEWVFPFYCGSIQRNAVELSSLFIHIYTFFVFSFCYFFVCSIPLFSLPASNVMWWSFDISVVSVINGNFRFATHRSTRNEKKMKWIERTKWKKNKNKLLNEYFIDGTWSSIYETDYVEMYFYYRMKPFVFEFHFVFTFLVFSTRCHVYTHTHTYNKIIAPHFGISHGLSKVSCKFAVDKNECERTFTFFCRTFFAHVLSPESIDIFVRFIQCFKLTAIILLNNLTFTKISSLCQLKLVKVFDGNKSWTNLNGIVHSWQQEQMMKKKIGRANKTSGKRDTEAKQRKKKMKKKCKRNNETEVPLPLSFWHGKRKANDGDSCRALWPKGIKKKSSSSSSVFLFVAFNESLNIAKIQLDDIISSKPKPNTFQSTKVKKSERQNERKSEREIKPELPLQINFRWNAFHLISSTTTTTELGHYSFSTRWK